MVVAAQRLGLIAINQAMGRVRTHLSPNANVSPDLSTRTIRLDREKQQLSEAATIAREGQIEALEDRDLTRSTLAGGQDAVRLRLSMKAELTSRFATLSKPATASSP